MDYTTQLRDLFMVITIIVIGTISMIKIGTIDAHAIVATSIILLPAVVVMGILSI